MAGSDDGFITLPPGMFDPSTIKTPARVERPREKKDDIVFVPMTPGMAPVAPPAAPAEFVATPNELTVTSSTPAAQWALHLPDGGHVVLGRHTLIGRNPAPQAAWPEAQLLPVADPTSSVSKTHAVFEVDDSGLWVNDLASTNGVWVVSGSDVTEAMQGRRVRVPAGASVELGDYILTVSRA